MNAERTDTILAKAVGGVGIVGALGRGMGVQGGTLCSIPLYGQGVCGKRKLGIRAFGNVVNAHSSGLQTAVLHVGIDQIALGIANDDFPVKSGIEIQTLVAVLVEHDGRASTVGNGKGNVLRTDGTGRQCNEGSRKEGEDFFHASINRRIISSRRERAFRHSAKQLFLRQKYDILYKSTNATGKTVWGKDFLTRFCR